MNRSTAHIILFLLVAIIACKKPVEQEDLIKSAVAIRLDQWKKDQHAACHEKAVMKAEAYVDSIMVVLALPTKLDTINKPPKPNKPLKPVFKTKPDSVVVDEIKKN